MRLNKALHVVLIIMIATIPPLLLVGQPRNQGEKLQYSTYYLEVVPAGSRGYIVIMIPCPAEGNIATIKANNIEDVTHVAAVIFEDQLTPTLAKGIPEGGPPAIKP